MKELNVDIEKEEALEIIKTDNLILAYHGDYPNGKSGVCTDGIAVAFIIKLINNSAITLAHSHLDKSAPSKIKQAIINNLKNKSQNVSTVMFSDTTISKNKFIEFLQYLEEMIPHEIDDELETKLTIVFQDHHLGPMENVIKYLSNINNNVIDDNMTEDYKIIFNRIGNLIKQGKLVFTKITSNECENNKQPSSELLFNLFSQSEKITNEKLFFIKSCILSETVSIFPATDNSVTKAIKNFKNFVFEKFKINLENNQIIDLLDFIDDKLNNLAQEIHQKHPFENSIDVNEESLDYSSALMNEIIKSQSLILELYNVAKENNIPVSQKKLEVENSQKGLKLLNIDDERYFVVTSFPRQGSTRAMTFIVENTIDMINKKEKKQIIGFLLPNLSGSISVIPFNGELYNLLNDENSIERKAILNLSFKVGGHSNSFVLFSVDCELSNKFNESLTKENSTEINSVSYYFQNKNKHDSCIIETKKDIMYRGKLAIVKYNEKSKDGDGMNEYYENNQEKSLVDLPNDETIENSIRKQEIILGDTIENTKVLEEKIQKKKSLKEKMLR